MSYVDTDTSLTEEFKETLDKGGFSAPSGEKTTVSPKKSGDLSLLWRDISNFDVGEGNWVHFIASLAEYLGVLSPDDAKNLQKALSSAEFRDEPLYKGPIDGDQNSPELKASLDKFSKEYGGALPAHGASVDTDKLMAQGLFKKGEWSVSVQMTGLDNEGARHDMALGEIVVVDPQGHAQSFPFRSGGWGAHGDDSMLPGLSRDNMKPVSYDLDWSSYIVEGANLPAGMKGADGAGSWLRLGTNAAQLKAAGLSDAADRGGALGQDHNGFFGIHTDGGVPGSLGCIVLEDGVSEQLFKVFESIPPEQRPGAMNVLPPQEVIDRSVTFDVAYNVGAPQ